MGAVPVSRSDLKQMLKDVMDQKFKSIDEYLHARATENAKAVREGKVLPFRKNGISRHGLGYDKLEGKGLAVARFCIALAQAGGHKNTAEASKIAASWAERASDDPEVKAQYEAVANALGETKALAESTMIDGGALTPDQFSSEFIEILRPKAIVRKSGARVLPMNGASMSMGKQSAAGTASYVGENQNVLATQQQWGTLQAQVKKLMAVTPISNDLIRDAVLSAEMLVRDDLVKVAALTEDLNFIRGPGTQFSPKGIRNWVQAANVFNADQAGSAATVAEVMKDLAELVNQVEESNVPIDDGVWYMRPRSFWYLLKLVDSVGSFYFRQELSGPNPSLFGFPVFKTTQIPNNLNELGGSNESEVYFGSASECLITENTQLLVQVYPGGTYVDANGNLQSGISQDQTVIVIVARHDFLLRHPGSFAVLKQVKWGA